MKAILSFLKPVVELAFVLLPGLVIVALGIVWWSRRRNRLKPENRAAGPEAQRSHYNP